MSEIKAIVFDCFGVLVQDSFVTFCLKHFAGDKEKMEAARHADALANKKIITIDELIEQFARLAEISVEECKEEVEFGGVNEPIFDLITELKPHYRIGFLSNANDNYLNKLFSAEQVALFDAVSISSEIGFIKPDAGAYEDIANKLGLRHDECIFIDDQAVFCEGARRVGMPAIHFTEVDTLRRDLKQLGLIDA